MSSYLVEKKSFHLKDKPVNAVQAAVHEAHKYILPRIQFSVAFAKFWKHDCEVRHGYPSVWNNSAPIGQIFMKFDV